MIIHDHVQQLLPCQISILCFLLCIWLQRGIPSSISNDQESDSTPTGYQVGDFVAAFWNEGRKYHWYLANIVEFINDDALLLTYFKKAGNSKDGQMWISPENPELIVTDTYQIVSPMSDLPRSNPKAFINIYLNLIQANFLVYYR